MFRPTDVSVTRDFAPKPLAPARFAPGLEGFHPLMNKGTDRISTIGLTSTLPPIDDHCRGLVIITRISLILRQIQSEVSSGLNRRRSRSDEKSHG